MKQKITRIGKTAVATGFAFLLMSHPLSAEESGLVEAIQAGTANLSLRLRYEDVQQQLGIDRGAQALTLRSRLSYRTQAYKLISGLVEFDDISALPDDHNYNSGSNGQLDDALVTDPEGTEVNQVWLAYGLETTLIKFGRQRLLYDNQRFVGNEAWRQNEQTFDGLSVFDESMNLLRLNFAQLNRVQGTLGDAHPLGQQDLDAQLFNIQYWAFVNSTLTFYAYLLDNRSGMDDWDTDTYGVRFEGDIKNEPAITYAVEYASQKSAADNPQHYSANYQLIELGGRYMGIRLNLGLEVLGADGAGYFVTPLASLQQFQGSTGQFQNQGLGNIGGGVRDQYVSLGYDYSDTLQLLATCHKFNSDNRQFGPGALGREWGFSISKTWQNYSVIAKFADYARDHYGDDTRTVWLSAEARF